MIGRFCLYGFLKNQRYFEPFLVLAFLDKGLSFTMIGALIGFRAISVAIMEVPTGAVADVLGRRWAMICSHVAYVVAFFTFGLTQSTAALFAAMFAFAVGEAFRTGTHKAIIFAWLKSQGRETEKTHIYGITRSWSQIGSALSVLLACAMVFVLKDYSVIFWISAIPASLNIVNFLTYPPSLDGVVVGKQLSVLQMLLDGLKQSFTSAGLRRPLLESMGYEGMFKASKDYLQPILQQVMLAVPWLLFLETMQRTTVLIAIVYTLFYLSGGLASRWAGRLSTLAQGEEQAARWLWAAFGLTFVMMLVGSVTAWTALAAVSFVALSALQNTWRPILIGRVANQADERSMATVLSVEEQVKSLGIAVLAPILGFAIDRTPPPYQFAPLGVVGILIAFLAVLSYGTKSEQVQSQPGEAIAR